MSFSEFWASRKTKFKDWDTKSEEKRHIDTFYAGVEEGLRLAADQNKMKEERRQIDEAIRMEQNRRWC